MSICGIGTDIVDIDRIKKKLDKKGFAEVIFTPKEIAYCQSQKHSEQSFAARFAAKEAYMKALGIGWSKDADFKEIEITKNDLGSPEVTLSGDTKLHFEKLNLKQIFISLSHTETSAVAFVIIT